MPKVSVIMPMYNSEKFVKQAIESLLNQTFQDIEIIAINDGSTDCCGDVVRQIKDPRLVFIDRENRGFVNTLNECIEMSKGEYIARLDDDDWCYKTRIEKEVRFLDDNPEAVLVGTLNDEEIDGKIVHTRPTPIISPQQIQFSLVFDNYAFAHSSFMIRKSVLINEHIRYEVFKQVPDYHMITQLIQYGKVARIQEPLVVYRIHKSQSTQVRSARMKTDEWDQAVNWYIDSLKIESEYKLAIKKGTLRKLRTKEDICLFADALHKYAEKCEVNNLEEKKCFCYLIKRCMVLQYCDLKFLFEVIRSGLIRWMFSKEGVMFIVKCLIRRNKYYLETRIDF